MPLIMEDTLGILFDSVMEQVQFMTLCTIEKLLLLLDKLITTHYTIKTQKEIDYMIEV